MELTRTETVTGLCSDLFFPADCHPSHPIHWPAQQLFSLSVGDLNFFHLPFSTQAASEPATPVHCFGSRRLKLRCVASPSTAQPSLAAQCARHFLARSVARGLIMKTISWRRSSLTERLFPSTARNNRLRPLVDRPERRCLSRFRQISAYCVSLPPTALGLGLPLSLGPLCARNRSGDVLLPKLAQQTRRSAKSRSLKPIQGLGHDNQPALGREIENAQSSGDCQASDARHASRPSFVQ